jgi:ketosteroid isomerase-like protein
MTDEQRVREANERFYLAMTTADIDEMDEVWLNDSTVVCVHPGREALFGYEGIRESWLQIFSSNNSMAISSSLDRTTVVGDMAWVVCNETISVQTPEGLGAAAAQATNIYRRIAGAWKMVLHHASGVPFTLEDEWPEHVN